MSALNAALDTLEKSQEAPSADWIAQLRRAGRSKFDSEGLPSPKMEAWRGTNVTPLAGMPFVAASPGEAPRHKLANLKLGGPRFVFSGGELIASEGTAPEGLWAGTFADAIEKFGNKVSGWVTGEETEFGAFEALNRAFLAHGAVVVVEAGASIDVPVEIVYSMSSQQAAAIQQPRTLIVAEDNSRASVVEIFISEGDTPTLTNAVSRAVIGENANVEHARVQFEGPSAWHVSTVTSRQARSSNYTAHHINLGARVARHNTRAVLDGEGANCLLNGLYLASGDQHVDNHTWIEHRVPQCESHELFKGILDDRSSGVFSGYIHVFLDAQKTDAYQSSANLLLSDDAVIDAQPQLEIYADDVKCSHGSTTGQISEDALFYLRSRGLTETHARGLLVRAFARDVTERLTETAARERVDRLLLERLPGGT